LNIAWNSLALLFCTLFSAIQGIKKKMNSNKDEIKLWFCSRSFRFSYYFTFYLENMASEWKEKEKRNWLRTSEKDRIYGIDWMRENFISRNYFHIRVKFNFPWKSLSSSPLLWNNSVPHSSCWVHFTLFFHVDTTLL
jgi:hypothetical protein